jgi:hypothetical protein
MRSGALLARGSGALAAGCILVLAGCGPRAEIVLQQPFAPPTQRHLRLDANQAYHAASGGRHVCMLTFPLPGAEVGPRAYVLYVSLPAGAGHFAIETGDPHAARGFLIQEIGSLAGRTDFVGGSIDLKTKWGAPAVRLLSLDVRCQDGTKITGQALAQRDPARIAALEREFASDVALTTLTQSRSRAETEPAAPEEWDR